MKRTALILTGIVLFTLQSFATLTIREAPRIGFCAGLLRSGKDLATRVRNRALQIPRVGNFVKPASSSDIRLRQEISEHGIKTEIELGRAFRVLHETETLKIYARLHRGNLSHFQELASELELFRISTRSDGFLHSAKQQTVILDNTDRIRFHGPKPPTQTWDVLDETATAFHDEDGESLIIIPQIPYQSDQFDRSLLFREMYRLDLRATFGPNHTVTENKIINGALVDFAAANYLGTPQVGSFRRLDQSAALGRIVFSNDHSDEASLVLSSMLWKLRQMIGQQGISRIYYPLMVYLNLDMWMDTAQDDPKAEIQNIRAQFLMTLIQTVESMYGPLSDQQKLELAAF